jgi:sterol desaturase/sphingolipid hydroxylase (fatty acid hydroxylase superfamily)
MTGLLYVAFIIVVFVLAALGEWAFVARPGAPSDARLVTNFGLYLLNIVMVGVVPLGSVAAAAYGEAHGLGLLRLLAAPAVLVLALAFLWRSLMQYALHRLAHAVPLLWRVHRVHHADRQLDASTAVRSHPLEQLFVLAPISLGIVVLGLPVWAVVAVDLTTFGVVVATHANLRLPPHWSSRIERLLVTPGFHLVHHSAVRTEHDANFGEVLTIWDRLFATCRSADVRRIGLGELADDEADRLIGQLCSPFRRGGGGGDDTSAVPSSS